MVSLKNCSLGHTGCSLSGNQWVYVTAPAVFGPLNYLDIARAETTSQLINQLTDSNIYKYHLVSVSQI